jgi:hypothetical protein
MNKKNILFLFSILIVLLISSFAFAGDLGEITPLTKIKTHIDGTIAFASVNDDVNDKDYFIGDNVISVNSGLYDFKSVKVKDVFITQCKKSEIIGNSIVCIDTETIKAGEEFKVATLILNGCEDDKTYKIYKIDSYTEKKKEIIENGYIYDYVVCTDNSLIFNVESFSSYASIQVALQTDNELFYNMSNISTTVIDLSGNLNGTASGVTFTNDSISKYSYFDGANDYITTNSKHDYLQRTYNLWVQSVDIDVGRMILTSKDDGFGQGVYIENNHGGSSDTYMGIKTNTDSSFSSLSNGNNGSWYNLAFSFDESNGEVKYYVDGVSVKNDTVTGTITEQYELTLGAGEFLPSDEFEGYIANVGVWSRILTDDEILTIYNEGRSANPYEYSNFTILATDFYSEDSISTFNATINGSFYSTTNGSIITPYLLTDNVTLNITVQSENYTSYSNISVNGSIVLTTILTPSTLEDFSLITPSNSLTTDNYYNITWSEAVSPTSKVVNYTLSVYYNSNSTLIGTITLTDLSYNLNVTDYNADIYNIVVSANETSTGASFEHSSLLYVDKTNYVYFTDERNDALLTGKDIAILFPTSDRVSYVTDSEGKINFSSFVGTSLIDGLTIVTYEGDSGYITPISFNFTSTVLPYNLSYNISRTNISIFLRDSETSQLITDNITVSITGLGTFSTTNGTLFFEDISIVAGTYIIYTTSTNYTYTQRTFTYTSQSPIDITLSLYNKLTSNVGNIYVNVYDSSSDQVTNADVRLQELNVNTNTFVEVSQGNTGSDGQANFQVLLEARTYRFYVTGIVNGVSYSGYSNLAGEIFYEDGTTVNIFLSTFTDTSTEYVDGLNINVTYTELINNISNHTVNFYDSLGTDHEVCLGYYYMDGVIEKTVDVNCVTGSSGTINEPKNLTVLLDDYRVIVKVFTNVSGKYTNYYTQSYSSVNSFEEEFGDLLKPLLMMGLIMALGLSLLLKRIDIFVYIEIILSLLWATVAPSYMTWGSVAVFIIFGMSILYLAKQRNGVATL